MTIDWDDPAERLALIERVGAQEYSRQRADHIRDRTIETVNGYRIYLIRSRFGNLYAVEDLGKASASLDGARDIARSAAPRQDKAEA